MFPLTRLQHERARNDCRRLRPKDEERVAVAIIILWEEQGPANERPMQTIYVYV